MDKAQNTGCVLEAMEEDKDQIPHDKKVPAPRVEGA